MASFLIKPKKPIGQQFQEDTREGTGVFPVSSLKSSKQPQTKKPTHFNHKTEKKPLTDGKNSSVSFHPKKQTVSVHRPFSLPCELKFLKCV
jgi:hypothetical protein